MLVPSLVPAQEIHCAGMDADKAVDALLKINAQCDLLMGDYADKVDALAVCDDRNPQCMNMSARFADANQQLHNCNVDLEAYTVGGGQKMDWGAIFVAFLIGGGVIGGYIYNKHVRKGIKGPRERFYGGIQQDISREHIPFDMDNIYEDKKQSPLEKVKRILKGKRGRHAGT